MPIQSKATTYEFTPEEIGDLIRAALELKDEDVTDVRFVIQEVGADIMDRFPGTPTVTKVTVRVEHQ